MASVFRQVVFLQLILSSLSILPTGEAAAEGRLWQDGWVCGNAVSVGVAQLRDLNVDSGITARDRLPTFVVASEILPDSGAMIFIKRPQHWVAVPMQKGAGTTAVLINSKAGAALIFTQFAASDAGDSYTVLSTVDGFRTMRCGQISFPSSVDIESEDDDPSFRLVRVVGRLDGLLKAIVEENYGSHALWYRYDSKDQGATWSKPHLLLSKPTSRRSPFVKLAIGNADNLFQAVLQDGDIKQ